VATGIGHTCVLTTGKGVRCWGLNDSGQLGTGSTTNRSTPLDTDVFTGVQAIAAAGHHTCAPTAAGGVRCWGANYDGQLGDNSLSCQLGYAYRIPPLGDARRLQLKSFPAMRIPCPPGGARETQTPLFPSPRRTPGRPMTTPPTIRGPRAGAKASCVSSLGPRATAPAPATPTSMGKPT